MQIIRLCLFICYPCLSCQARINRFLEKTKKKSASNTDSEEHPEALMKERERLRRKVTTLMKQQKMHEVKKIVKQQDDGKPWGQENQVKVGLGVDMQSI